MSAILKGIEKLKSLKSSFEKLWSSISIPTKVEALDPSSEEASTVKYYTAADFLSSAFILTPPTDRTEQEHAKLLSYGLELAPWALPFIQYQSAAFCLIDDVYDILNGSASKFGELCMPSNVEIWRVTKPYFAPQLIWLALEVQPDVDSLYVILLRGRVLNIEGVVIDLDFNLTGVISDDDDDDDDDDLSVIDSEEDVLVRPPSKLH